MNKDVFMKTNAQELQQLIESADDAINRKDFDELMKFYSDDATLVVMPGKEVSGKDSIRRSFVSISEYFNHSLVVTQEKMAVIEAGDTALVLANTRLKADNKTDSPFSVNRNATYVFKKWNDDWRCVIDNSYGTELICSPSPPTLHLICGKMASGKSTLAGRLASEPNTVLISEDEWLSRLYPGEITTLTDYVRFTARLRDVMGIHVETLLRAGNSVVLDFPANTLDSRQWMSDIYRNAGVVHCLHYLDVSDEECKTRLSRRNEDGSHRFNTSEAESNTIASDFVAPSSDEGFHVIRYDGH
jgi:uncharacterized protein (TIGR02246 family)